MMGFLFIFGAKSPHMKLFLQFLFISAFAISAKAQDIPFKFLKSEIFKDEFKESNIVFAEEAENGGILIIRSYVSGGLSSGRGYYIEEYDSNLKLVKEYEQPLKYANFEKYGTVLGIIKGDKDIQFVDMFYNINEKAYICSAYIVDFNNSKTSKKELFRLSREEIKQYGNFFMNQTFYSQDTKIYEEPGNESGVSMIVNENRTAFAITIDMKTEKSEALKLYLFDKNLNKKFEHIFVREIKDKKFRYENVDVSKDGNALYLLGKVYADEKKNKKTGGKYQYELTRFSFEGQKTQVFDTEEHFSGSMTTIASPDKITCIGFYSDQNDNHFKGISYFELDPVSLAIRKSKFNPFSQQFMIDKYGEEKDKELKNLIFKKIHITKNNDIIFNAEEFYVSSNNNQTFFNYDDIVSAKINTDGELVWARNINKAQFTTDTDAYISYTSTIKNDDTYFFINASEKIKKLSNDRILFKHVRKNKSNLNIIRINKNGDFDFQEVLNNESNEVPFMVSQGIVNKESVFFLGKKGKDKQLLKISL